MTAPPKTAIIDFVGRVTGEGGPDFVPVEERIATFDNDGTLWSEQPMYFQILFAIDRLKSGCEEPIRRSPRPSPTRRCSPVISAALAALGEKGLLQIVAATHAGMTVADFHALVADWIKTARHPRFDRPYTDLDLPADAGTAGLSEGQQLQDLHRVRWRYRIPCGPGRRQRHGIPPERDRRLVRQDPNTGSMATRHRAAKSCPRSSSSTTGPSKAVGINRFIGRRPVVRRRQFGRRPARCCNGPRSNTGRALRL